MKLKQFLQQETVLTAAAVLAVVSAFFVPPDVQYIGYIDLRTLAILFSLMTVMAGLRRQGFFDGLGRALLSRTHSTFQLTMVLVGLCFFGSMFITNDVSLLTFVPFTFVVLSRLGADVRCSLLIPVVCMQTIAANLGSMLTPIGNPQNLYLYGKSGMSIGGFVLLMLPYTLVSLLLLLAWAAMVCRKTSAALSVDELVSSSASQGDQKIILLYLVLFAVCLLSVIRVLPYGIAFAAVLVCALFADPRTLRTVDYSLLLTFVAFFIFIGNLGRIPAFSGWLQELLTGREVLVAVLASQVTSNVPAALLLSGFTAETQALIIGTNLGGLGTLIASMASLISYRQIARELPQGKKQYFGLFTLSNLIFLAILLGVWFMSIVEHAVQKISPKAVKFFTVPLASLFAASVVTILALGPIGTWVGNLIGAFFKWLEFHAGWAVPTLVGALSPLMVMTGTHYGLIPIGINNLATAGFDTVVGPGMLTSNVAQGAAGLAVALRTKNKDTKQLAMSAGITGTLGITEPVLYGVNLKFIYPLISAMIGGGIAFQIQSI